MGAGGAEEDAEGVARALGTINEEGNKDVETNSKVK